MKILQFKIFLVTVLISFCFSPHGLASSEKYRETLGLSYNDVMYSLNAFFKPKLTTPVDGKQRYMGTSLNGVAIIEIIGSKTDISQTGLVVMFPNDNNGAVIENTAILLRFTKNTVPEWNKSCDWILSNMQKKSEGSKVIGKKMLSYTFIKEMSMLTVIVRPSAVN